MYCNEQVAEYEKKKKEILRILSESMQLVFNEDRK